MILGYVVLAMALASAGAAHAADAPADRPFDGAPEAPGLTGSPSNATATVSPTTIAQALSRQDATVSGNEPRFGLSYGTSIASGDFGTAQGSRLVSTAIGARLAIGTLRLSASIPYLNIRSRGVIFSGIDSTPVIASVGTPGRKRTNDGLGDITFGAAYTILSDGSTPEIEFSGRVKVPSATRSSGLSTGKTDYSAGVQATKLFGRVAPFVSGTYRIFGDPSTIDLRNGFAGSAGAAVVLSERSTALFSYHYARGASRLVRNSHELFAGASGKLPGSNLRLTSFVTKGVSSGAASVSGGLSLSLDF
jgi:hypothetical protein